MSMGKRLLSLLLALCMLWSVMATSVLAVPEETVIPLEASRLSADKLPDGNIIYFGSAAASLPEEAAVYSVPIYREGDVSGEAAVEIHSIDITALYGEDYELVTDEAEIIGGDETILERYSRQCAALSETGGGGSGQTGERRSNGGQ